MSLAAAYHSQRPLSCYYNGVDSKDDVTISSAALTPWRLSNIPMKDLAALKDEKQQLHITLRSFEQNFFEQHQRQVSCYHDIKSVSFQYRRYKEIKKEIRALKQRGGKRNSTDCMPCGAQPSVLTAQPPHAKPNIREKPSVGEKSTQTSPGTNETKEVGAVKSIQWGDVEDSHSVVGSLEACEIV